MPIPTTAEIDLTNLNEVTQISIATQRSPEDLEAQHNVEKVQEHLVEEEIETMVEGTENVNVDKFMDEIFNDQKDPDNRIEPGSHKESPKVKKRADILTINDDKEEEESAGDEFILRNRENRKGIEMNRRYGYMFRHLRKSFMLRKDFNDLENAVKSTLKKVILIMVDKRVKKIVKKLVPLYVAEVLLLDRQQTQTDIAALVAEAIKFEKPAPPVAPCRLATIRTIDHEDHHDDDARPKGESNAKRQRMSEHGTYTVRESSSEQVMDDDEVPSKEVSPELLKEILREVDEAQL
ncbi:hypothetical protein Tco_0948569 [Tanacetum coccineum]